MIINSQCDKCGSPVLFDDTREFMFCWHCGAQIFNPGQAAEPNRQLMPVAPVPAPAAPVSVVPPPVPNFYTGPNLIVSYQSDKPQYPMYFRIHTTNEKFNIGSGQSMSFRLNQGRHALFFGFAGKYYRRDIRIVIGNAPVKIECSWFGRARIDIIQSSAVYPQSY